MFCEQAFISFFSEINTMFSEVSYLNTVSNGILCMLSHSIREHKFNYLA
jgi:hypothetical protein